MERDASARSDATVFVTLTWSVSRAFEADAGDLLAAARRGDEAAQTALFEHHKQRVARQIVRMTGDANAVDDLVQEVFIAAFSRLSSFRGDSQLDTWLYTITANKVRNWWDSKRRRESRERQAANAYAMTAVASEESPEEHLRANEQLEDFYRALGSLPPKFREAFTLRAIDNLSLQQASQILGVPISTVSYRTRRAERMLCEVLGLPEQEGT